jgi:hypothetical protein
MTVGCNSLDVPPIIDPPKCLPGNPCPPIGGGTDIGGGARGGSGGTGGAAGTSGTGGAAAGSSITGRVAAFDNDTFSQATPISSNATVTGQSTAFLYNRSTVYNGNNYTLTNVALPSYVAVQPSLIEYMDSFAHVVTSGENQLRIVLESTLADILTFGNPWSDPEDDHDPESRRVLFLDPGRAQIVIQFVGTTAAVSGITVTPEEVTYEAAAYFDGSAWLDALFQPATGTTGLAYMINVGADVFDPPAGANDTVKLNYSGPVTTGVNGSIEVQVAQGFMTFVDVAVDSR